MQNQSRIKSNVILHIAPIKHDRISGLTFAIPPLIEAIQRQGLQTGLLTTSTLGRYGKPESYPVVYIRDLPLWKAIAAMPEPLNNPDLIVFHSTYILEHILLAYEAIQRKIPYIIKPHGGMTLATQQTKYLKKKVGNFLFFHWMVENATALHCLTEQEAVDVKKIWNRPVFIVGNGVHIPQYEQVPRPSNLKLKFIFLGRLDINHKGLDLLIEACHISQAYLRQHQAQILLYGSEVNGSKAKIKDLIRYYQIQDIVYLKDSVWGEEKQAVFQSADLFIHTSRFEGHPMAVLEALSHGIPCLLTPGTNMAKEVSEAQAGWTVEANPAAIAQGLISVLNAQTEIPLRGQAGRNLVERKYSWAQIAKESQREYEKIISNHTSKVKETSLTSK
jgi:glycosyltransferase involved in cell wall biosynthesis